MDPPFSSSAHLISSQSESPCMLVFNCIDNCYRHFTAGKLGQGTRLKRTEHRGKMSGKDEGIGRGRPARERPHPFQRPQPRNNHNSRIQVIDTGNGSRIIHRSRVYDYQLTNYNSQYMAPNNNSQYMAPNNNSQYMAPNYNSQYTGHYGAPNYDTQYRTSENRSQSSTPYFNSQHSAPNYSSQYCVPNHIAQHSPQNYSSQYNTPYSPLYTSQFPMYPQNNRFHISPPPSPRYPMPVQSHQPPQVFTIPPTKNTSMPPVPESLSLIHI